MGIAASDSLRIFILNVGQADTSVIVTPKGNVLLIDAVNPAKIVALLETLGLHARETIGWAMITHPHNDHYSGMPAILNKYRIGQFFLAPFKHCDGTPGYHALINQIEVADIPRVFVGGHLTIQLDGGFPTNAGPTAEFSGPTNDVLDELGADLTPNHLSIITKLTLGRFVMVSAADAQMENWGAFDQAAMMPPRCDLLKAAHHGSRHGTQCERLERLNPTYSIVSSDPTARHSLPDLVGAATFCVHSSLGHFASLTRDSGTIEVRVDPSGTATTLHYSESATEPVHAGHAKPLNPGDKLTDWPALVLSRLNEMR
jgi:competence protein ComEC